MNTTTKYLVLFVMSILLAACGGTPPTVEATATPVPPPAPEAFVFGGQHAVEDVRRYVVDNCGGDLPVWFLHPDWRGMGVIIDTTSDPTNDQLTVGEVQVTYVAWAEVFINDRLVEFRPDGVEVFQLFEDKTTFELNPVPYIERAIQILDGDVEPVFVNAIVWRWEKDLSGDYEWDYWSWEIRDVICPST